MALTQVPLNMLDPVSGGLSFRNKLINGNFDIWQRTTDTGTWVAPITSYYAADRWAANSAGTGGTGSITRQAFTLGQPDVPNEPAYFLRWNVGTAASGQTTGSCWIEQRIEDVRTLAGQTVTLTFYAKGTGTLPQIYAAQTFGSGGSAQVVVTLASNVALNSTWTKYTYTFSLASISGKTIGTNSYLNIGMMVPINSTYTLDLAQVQLEKGSVATPFEVRPLQVELALCQRYYEKGYPQGTSPANGAIADTRQGVATVYGTTVAEVSQIRFEVVKRTTPTAILYNSSATGTAGQWALYNPSIGWVSYVSSAGTTDTALGVTLTVASLTSTGSYISSGNWAVSAEL